MGTIAHLLRPKGRSKVRVYTFDVDSVPSAETEYAHGLDVTPKAVALTPKTGAGGVDGYIMENKGNRSATSVTLKASVSGVYGEVTIVG